MGLSGKKTSFIILISIMMLILISSCSGTVETTTTSSPTEEPFTATTNTPELTPTFTLTITPSQTPDPWQRYNIQFGAQLIPSLGSHEAWMPIPRDWDNNGMRNIKIVEINPEPAEITYDDSETQIAHWIFNDGSLHTIEVVFEVDLARINQQIASLSEIESYDTSTEIYLTYTAPEPVIQSDNQIIIDTANRIVGDETNPYKQAVLLYNWVHSNLLPGNEPSIEDDALSSLKAGIGECSNHSNLLVALARSIGIPARNVAGIAHLKNFQNSGSVGHVWVEIYFPKIGWIQVDPSLPDSFGKINDIRLILSKGNSITIKRTDCNPNWERSWFHTPEGYYCGGLGPNEPLWIKLVPIN